MTTKPDKLQPLPPHRFASLFPAMTDEEFQNLVADINAKGQRVPITTIEEDGETLVLEGIHRQKACLALGIEPKRTPYQGNDPLGFVISANMHRRHLTPGQRAALAADIANMKPGRRGKHATSQVSRKAAAAAVGASERTTADAAKVKEEGDPTLFEAIKTGDIPPNVAADLTHASKEEQRETVKNIKRDAKGKPTRASRRTVKAASIKAKGEAKKKGKPVPKAKANGAAKDAGPSAETFKAAVYGFAADVERYVFQSKWLATIEHEKLPAKRRDEAMACFERLIKRAKELHKKLEGGK